MALGGLLALAALATAPVAQEQTGAEPATITVASWGGVYEAAQRKALFDPFTEATGIPVRVVTHAGGLAALRDRAGAEGWDVADLIDSTAIAGCEAGLLAPLDPERLDADHAHPLAADMAPLPLRRCGVPHVVFASVMAYDDRAFPGVKPSSIEDFFDTARFPGKRTVQKSPEVILEWALMAEGVPPEQVYDLLSTDRGLRLAFARLDTIRDRIVWWEDPATPARMLAEGRAAMASGYNGRFFSEAQAGAPLSVVWDGRVIGHDVWSVPRGAPHPEAARRFIRFATHPDRMARLAELIPYGPARRSALERIGLAPETGVPMRDHLPNAPQHGPRALVRDSDWYSHTRAMRQRRFEAWLAGNG